MEHHPIQQSDIVSPKLTGVAAILKPVVFKDGDRFGCLMGIDQETGVFGEGDSPEAALADWDTKLRQKLQEHGEDDYIVEYIKDMLQPKYGGSKALSAYLGTALRPPKGK